MLNAAPDLQNGNTNINRGSFCINDVQRQLVFNPMGKRRSTYSLSARSNLKGSLFENMQAANDGARKDVFGLYELANDGTILYSRLRTDDELSGPEYQIVGKDFFRDIARFENTDDLRRHFRSFIKGDRPADSFVFDCLFQTEVVRAKVFMTRAYEVDYDHTGGIVIMDIRKAGQ